MFKKVVQNLGVREIKFPKSCPKLKHVDGAAENELWGTSAAFFDYDADGDVDLYVVNYLNFTFQNNRICYNGSIRDYCDPKEYEGSPDLLYRNDDGKWVDVTHEAGLYNSSGKGLGVALADYDDDGDFDQGAIWLVGLTNTAEVKEVVKITGESAVFGGLLSDTEYFGTSVTQTSDLDGNGVRDLLVGADGTDATGSDKGAVWILLMEPQGGIKAAHRISVVEGGFQGDIDDGDFFGASVAFLSDLNGKQAPRLAVGAWGDDDGGLDRGAVWVLDLVSKCTVCGDGVADPGENCPDGEL